MHLLGLYLIIITFHITNCSYYIKNGENLNSIPNDIENTTTHLYLKGNDLSIINPGDFTNVPNLYHIDLSGNQFTEFPYLCDLGTQLLYISLRSNKLLSVLPESKLLCLSVLKNLDLSNTALPSFPDLSAVGDTLNLLYLTNLQLTQIDPDLLQNLTTLWFLDISSNGFTAVPDLKFLGDTLTHLWISRNKITDIDPETWQGMKKLANIKLEKNELTSFPNFSLIADTLSSVYLDFNPITNISNALIDPLVNLNTIGLGSENLTELPDLSGFGESLISLRIQSSNLLTIPPLKNMSALEVYSIRNNEFIKVIPDDYFIGWNSLEGLDLSYVPLTSFPNLEDVADTLQSLYIIGTDISTLPIEQMARLSSLETLDVRQTSIQIIPSLCSRVPDSLTIDARSSSIDFCNCDNLWLKYGQDLGVNVKSDSAVMCGGKKWTDLALNDLRNVCRGYNGTYRFTVPSLSVPGFFCHFPLGFTDFHSSHLHCTKYCLDQPGCITFNYNPADKKCLLIAPPSNPVSLDPNFIGDLNEWNMELLIDITN